MLTHSQLVPKSWTIRQMYNIQDFVATTAWYPERLTLVQPIGWAGHPLYCHGRISVRQTSQLLQINFKAEVLMLPNKEAIASKCLDRWLLKNSYFSNIYEVALIPFSN